MLKDFLKDLFGIVFYGLTFERVMWVALAVLGVWIGVRTWKAYKVHGADTPDLPFRVAMAALMVGAGGYYGAQAWFTEDYRFFFSSPLVLHTYGVSIATGFVFAIWLAARETHRTGLDRARMLDLSFWVLIAGMVGSRVVFMMVEWRSYYNRCFAPELEGLSAPDCMAVIRFWEGGLVFYGGLIGATLAGLLYLRKHKVEVWRYADAAAVGIPVGQFFGRLGCLSAGCCHGKYVPSERLFALRWPSDTAAYDVITGSMADGAEKLRFIQEGYVTAHPTQLYESGATLVIFIFLLWFRTRKQFNGQILATYIMLYAVVRACIEVFRGDTVRGFIFEVTSPGLSQALGLPAQEPLILSTSQLISLLTFGFGAFLWVTLKKKTASAPPQQAGSSLPSP